jgi:hypothetical protein
MPDGNNKTRLQDDENVLAYQFLNVVDSRNGSVTFGGNAFIRDGHTWEELFEGIAERNVSQFVNSKVIVWRTSKTTPQEEPDGFQRF